MQTLVKGFRCCVINRLSSWRGWFELEKNYKSFKLPFFIKVDKRYKPDAEFSTVKFPNPEEGAGALKLAMETADKNEDIYAWSVQIGNTEKEKQPIT